MSKIVWNSDEEKFEAIGYLAKPGVINCIEASVPEDLLEKFYKEFDGKYTSEFPYKMKPKSKYGYQFRIYLQDTDGCPKSLENYLDDRYYNRINDTAFIKELVEEYGFKLTHEPQDLPEIKNKVYEKCNKDKSLKKCRAAFDKGLSVYETFVSVLQQETAKKMIPAPEIIIDKAIPTKAGSKGNDSKVENGKSAFSDEQLYMMGLIGEEYIAHLLEEKNIDIINALGIVGEYQTEWFNNGFRENENWEDKSIGKGCDIIVADEVRKIYIEVKSSKRRVSIFTMTSKEMQTMEEKTSAYNIIKIDYLEKLVKGAGPDVRIINNPYESYFRPIMMKSATFRIGE